jgi:hypothetical protein
VRRADFVFCVREHSAEILLGRRRQGVRRCRVARDRSSSEGPRTTRDAKTVVRSALRQTAPGSLPDPAPTCTFEDGLMLRSIDTIEAVAIAVIVGSLSFCAYMLFFAIW